jgi:sorbitol-specific phosphotransferase system component IIBC
MSMRMAFIAADHGCRCGWRSSQRTTDVDADGVHRSGPLTWIFTEAIFVTEAACSRAQVIEMI